MKLVARIPGRFVLVAHLRPNVGMSGHMKRLLVAMAIAFGPSALVAHEVRPAYLELREEAANEFSVLWKTPAQDEMRPSFSPVLPKGVEAVSTVVTRLTKDASVQTWRVRALGPLRGQTIRIMGLESTMTDVLVSIEFADGTTWVRRLRPQEPTAEIPARQGGWPVAAEYLRYPRDRFLWHCSFSMWE